jgi:ABC-type antimicrobial peptide transport system permease subunit
MMFGGVFAFLCTIVFFMVVMSSANTLMMAMFERTREIGLRKAIGANNKDIMVQFLIEAILMSFLGGIVGILLGGGVSVLITMFAGWTVKVSWSSIILATAFSLIVGIVFGIWPAQKDVPHHPTHKVHPLPLLSRNLPRCLYQR